MTDTGAMEQSGPHDDLTLHEVRVLACLIEKESTTPDNYPLTLNALRNACNQSTSRDPVVSFGDHDVEQALVSLRERGLTRTVHSTSNRAAKYRHVLPEALQLESGELALVSVLMLRGPQTIGELKSRSERQHHFESTDQVTAVLEQLASRQTPLALHLERQPGQKDARWVHLLGDLATPGDGATEPPDAEGVSASGDPYGDATAEFYDLLAAGHWESFGLQALDLLAEADPAHGPILDIGAGTGVGFPYLQAALPGVRIHAIEPSGAMRTALHTRLAMDPALLQLTTVDPRPFGAAALPERACALVASATLGHLSDADRSRLWKYVAAQMPAGAPAVIEMLPPDRPVSLPPTMYRRLTVGDHVYEGWQQCEQVDERHMAWTMTYKVLRGDTTISESTVQSGWRCLSVDDVRAEIEPFGLALSEHDGCVVVTRPV